jgi:hypothetical protein
VERVCSCFSDKPQQHTMVVFIQPLAGAPLTRGGRVERGGCGRASTQDYHAHGFFVVNDGTMFLDEA